LTLQNLDLSKLRNNLLCSKPSFRRRSSPRQAQFSRFAWFRKGRSVQLTMAHRAWAITPNGAGLRRLIADCERNIEQRNFQNIMRDGHCARYLTLFTMLRRAESGSSPANQPSDRLVNG
jgi:hypothetical protein